MSVREIQHPERETSTVEAAGGYVRRMVQTEARGWGRPVSIPDAYDAAKDAHDSYYAAIEAKRARGDAVKPLLAPFPYFGGKRSVVPDVWARLGRPKQYIEPFCGSAAMLLGAPAVASLEVVNDASGFIANFWRAVKHQPAAAVAEWSDYPVSHIDLGARHGWLMEQRGAVGAALHDPDWPGDAKVAGWWLWGQCCWIGGGWCDWNKGAGSARHFRRDGRAGAGEGENDATSAGRGVQALGQVPHASDAGRGIWTSAGHTAWRWLHKLADRLERVRIVHGEWNRCLNSHYGGADTAIFLDPPYRAYEKVYGVAEPVADAVANWARDNAHLRIAICGHVGDYSLPGWEAVQWSRGKATYAGKKTTDEECIWYSPACIKPDTSQSDMFAEVA